MKKSKKDITLSTKLFGPILVIILLSAFMITTFTFYFFTIAFENDVEEKLHILAGKTKTIVSQNLSGKKPEDVIENIYSLNQFSNVAEIVFFDEAGKALYKNKMNFYNQFFVQDFIDIANFVFTTKGHDEVQQIPYIGETYFIYGVEVYNSEIPDLKYIGFAKEMGIYDQLNQILLFIMLPITSLTTLASIIAIRKVTNKIIRPVVELENYVRALEEDRKVDFEPSDISREIYSLGENVISMSEQLKEAQREQKLFFDNASHELKTPLMVIGGYGEGLAQGICPDTQVAGEIITAETSRLNLLVGNLMLLAKFDNKEMYTAKICINMKEFIEKIISPLNSIKPEYIEFALDIPEEIELTTNEELLRQAIINPLSNSLRYASSNISITCTEENKHIVLALEDDGGGIDEETLANIFVRFYKGKGGNIGLGMSIMKTAVEKMGGEVSVLNKNEGICYTIVLPK